MSTWTTIGGAVCVGVTVVGLLLSWLIWRKKGATRGMRAVAWSLLPLAAYLTHSVLLLGRIVNAVVRFAGASPWWESPRGCSWYPADCPC
jgi:hypothetical protein